MTLEEFISIIESTSIELYTSEWDELEIEFNKWKENREKENQEQLKSQINLSPYNIREREMTEIEEDIEYTCWNCSNRCGEECGIDGTEVYPDSEICDDFSEC